MSLSANTQATLLLTAYFNKGGEDQSHPLTTKEWSKFALWLRDNQLTPEKLLQIDVREKLSTFNDKKITHERIEALLNRGAALAFAIEKWTRAGLWVISRSDPDYPKKLKSQLRMDSPPFLFGCGNRQILNKAGIAVVGSRNTSNEDLSFSESLGIKASDAGLSIISGGAKGVDEAAMFGALGAEGNVIGVLADSLLRASSSKKYRDYLNSNNLVLISTFNPEAGFNAGNAMQRNKYIYCLSDAAIVVHSGKPSAEKSGGGTWTGALENLKKEWVPMWVKSTNDPAAGNAGLVANGARWLSGDIAQVNVEELMQSRLMKVEEPDMFSEFEAVEGQIESFDGTPEVENSVKDEPSETQTNIQTENVKSETLTENQATEEDAVISEEITLIQVEEAVSTTEPLPSNDNFFDISFYELFLLKVKPLIDSSPKTIEELVEALGIHKAQITAWLTQAVEDKKIKKNNKPVSYEWAKQSSLI